MKAILIDAKPAATGDHVVVLAYVPVNNEHVTWVAPRHPMVQAAQGDLFDSDACGCANGHYERSLHSAAQEFALRIL